MRRLIAGVLLALGACDDAPTGSTRPAPPVGASVAMLARAEGQDRIIPHAIAEDGSVVGEIHVRSEPFGHRVQAFAWRPGQGMQVLETSGRQFSAARDINNRGMVVGYVSISGSTREAALWTSAGRHRTFRLPPPEEPSSDAAAINERDAVALWRVTGAGAEAFIWSETGSLQPIAFPDSVSLLQPLDIDDEGRVVGSYIVGRRPAQAFVWSPADGFLGLGTLGGTSSVSRATNNRGVVVGDGPAPSGVRRPFVWTRARGMRQLPVLDPAWHGMATDVNDHGTVVGYQFTGNRHRPANRAFLWNEAWGATVDLGALAGLEGRSIQVYAINDRHQVLIGVVDEGDETGTYRTAAVVDLRFED